MTDTDRLARPTDVAARRFVSSSTLDLEAVVIVAGASAAGTVMTRGTVLGIRDPAPALRPL